MRVEMFQNSKTGSLVPISGSDVRRGPWTHHAYVPDPLSFEVPRLSPATYTAASDARAAIAALNARASLLPNPALLRRTTLRVEAQSTSALEGTYAPLEEVLGADEETEQSDDALREVLNYVSAAEDAFRAVTEGRSVGVSLICELQARLVRGTAADTDQAGRVRTIQVMIGGERGAPVHRSRFVPPPPGPGLEASVRDLFDWFGHDHGDQMDPVVAAALVHYQFETLHPFNDGNGRLGRLLVVLHLLRTRALDEPTLSVSPWFEARRRDYYDHLLNISAFGDWDSWVRFFAHGLAASARDTDARLTALVRVQHELKERVRAAGLRADTAMVLVDFAVARTFFTVRQVESRLGVSYGRANRLVYQLIEAGVLQLRGSSTYDRRFFAPDVLRAVASAG